VGAGLLVGGLFAPRAGDQSRKLIARKAQKVKKVVKNAVNDGTRYITRRGAVVRDQANGLIDRSKVIYRTAGKVVHAVL
jgi:gas vesicle protein